MVRWSAWAARPLPGRHVAGDELFLFGDAERYKQHVGPRLADALHDGFFFLGLEVAMLRARDPQSRITLGQLLRGSGSHAGRGA